MDTRLAGTAMPTQPSERLRALKGLILDIFGFLAKTT